MRLWRYFSKLFLGSTLLVWFGLIVLVVAVTLIESAGRLASAKSTGLIALKLAGYSAIAFGYQVLPVSCFLGVLVTGTMLAKRGELLAVYAAGIRSTKLWFTFLSVTLFLSLGGMALGEWAVPYAITRIERLTHENFRKVDAQTRYFNQRTQWFKEGEWLLYLPEVNTQTQVFIEPTVYILHKGLLGEVLTAESLYYFGNTWHLKNVDMYSVGDPKMQTFNDYILPLKVMPDDLVDVTGNPKQMTTSRVLQLIERRQHAGFDTTQHRVELHSRFAFSLLSFGLVLLAMPWILHPDRRRSLASMLGIGVIVVAVLLSFTQVLRLLALGQKVSAPVGAWAPLGFAFLLLPVSFWLFKKYAR